MVSEKCYVITSLIESVDEGAEVNVIGIERTKKEAWGIVSQAVSEAKETYEENDIDYEIKSYEESVILISECETITIEYHESEVLI